MVRAEAYLAVGGFHELLVIGGEESLLCYDLAAAGWERRYLEQAVAYHHPSPDRPGGGRRQALQRRNQALVAWLRRPLPVAAAETWRLPAALVRRRALPATVEQEVRLLEQTSPASLSIS